MSAQCFARYEHRWNKAKHDRSIAPSNHPPKHTQVFTSIKDGNGRTALHLACSSGRKEAVEWMLTEHLAAIIDAVDDKGMTALSLALITGHADVAALLVKAGADVNKAAKDGVTCLHRAAGHGDLSSVELLAQHGADIECQSNAGTPLHWAAGEGHNNVVQKLLSLGANVNAQNKQGVTPIIMAAAGGHGTTGAILANANADTGLIMGGGLTVLHICSDLGSLEAVSAILNTESGRKTANLQNDAGLKPIDLAALSNHPDVVSLLMQHTALNGSESFDDIMAAGAQRAQDIEAVRQRAAVEREQNAVDLNSILSHESTEPAKTVEAKQQAEQLKDEGNALFSAKPRRVHEAIAAYTQAIQLDGSNRALWSNRSAAYMSAGDHKRALVDATVCRQLSPDWSKACYRMAVAREALGQYEEAAVAAWEGVQIDNNNEDLKKILQRCVASGRKANLAATSSSSSSSS